MIEIIAEPRELFDSAVRRAFKKCGSLKETVTLKYGEEIRMIFIWEGKK